MQAVRRAAQAAAIGDMAERTDRIRALTMRLCYNGRDGAAEHARMAKQGILNGSGALLNLAQLCWCCYNVLANDRAQSQKDADRIKEHTGDSVDEMTEEELVQAMKDLGIESIDLSDEDRAALAAQGNQAKVDGATITYQGQPQYGPPQAAPPAAEAAPAPAPSH